MALTVTATSSGADSANGIGLYVEVVTGALPAASQPGTVLGSLSVTTPQAAITPGHSGSWAYGSVLNGTAATAFSSIDANTTFNQNTADAPHSVTYGSFRSTSGTTTSSTTYGAAAPTESSGTIAIAIAEILASGTLGKDASTPAAVSASGAKTVSTASFTPPAGSLLVATVASNGDGTGSAVTIAVTTTGLTWTRVAACPSTPVGPLASVWVADVPGAIPAAASLSGTGTLTAGAVVSVPRGAALAGTGTLTVAPTVSIPSAAALNGTGTLTAGGTVTAIGQGSASLSGDGTLTVAGGLGWSASAPLAGTGTLTAGFTGLMLQSAALAGTGLLLVSPVTSLQYTAGLFGAGFLSVPQVAGGLVAGVGGASVPQALPGSSQVAVAPPGSSNWQWLGTLGQVTALTYSYVCPGGADKMTCTVQVPASYRTQLFNPGWQVKITRGGHQVWSGKLDEPQPSRDGWTLTAVGAGNRGQDFLAVYSGTWPAGQPDGAVNAAITRGLPWVNPGIGSPSGIWLGQSVDSGAQTITGLLNLVTSRGGLTWYVNSQPGGLYGGDDLSVFPLPTVPTRLLVATNPVARTLGGDVNTIYIRYAVTSDNASTGAVATYSTVTAVNAQSVAAHGTIETYIDISDAGVLSSAAAQAVGTKALQLYTRASFAGPFQASYGQLLNMGGAPVDPGTDQASNMVQMVFTDYPYGGEVSPGPIRWIIGSYSWDDYRQIATISPMQVLDQSLSGLLSAGHASLMPVAVAAS